MSEEIAEFNPSKEEFEHACSKCFSLFQLMAMYQVSTKELNRYVWRVYKESANCIFNKYKRPLKDLFKFDVDRLTDMVIKGYGIEHVAKAFGLTSKEVSYYCQKELGKSFEQVCDACIMLTRVSVRQIQTEQMVSGDYTSANVTATNWFAKQIDEQKDNNKVVEVKSNESKPYEQPAVLDKVYQLLEGRKNGTGSK